MFPFSVEFTSPQGEILLDVMFLTAGTPVTVAKGESVALPATAFFRAGYTDLDADCAVLRKKSDPNDLIFYTLLPQLDKGTYTIELDYQCDDSTSPGELVLSPSAKPIITVDIPSDPGFSYVYDHWENVPVRISLKFSRDTDVSIKSMTLTRTD